ncbi:penicillin acylase family protein [Nocardioides sp. SYSU D00038]|uniref:penicillin acylase family protein n=1 Tax=Nocardioides sp. SYSU D00038 TaxID=2812554 RepID=UPI001967A587|nr:penicillin acylase family protein [Nocardioides sp. SYSU D00038]
MTDQLVADPPHTPRRGGFGSWPTPVRVALVGGLALVVLVAAVVVTGVVLVRRPFPQYDGSTPLPGLEGRVEVVRDEHGIPQLYADSLDDLMRGQGYVHAQERFFEMDVRRHATAGRLAELFGESGLDSDKVVRTMGWRRVAERELALVRPATRTALQAYADGVNAFLDAHEPSEIAVEYTVLAVGGLDYAPEDWTPVDSLAWLKAMAWDLRGNMQDEIERTLTVAAVGAERAAELWPPYPFAEHRPIVAGGTVAEGAFAPATATATEVPGGEEGAKALALTARALDDLPAWLGRGDGVGSNSWVVDGDHTTTGEPLLANDPHLGVGMPGVWMQMGLHCRTVGDDCPLDVAGFTFSGVPGVIIGHNADIAWGFTNLSPDVTDLYVERVRDDQWWRAGEWRPLRSRRETIEVDGGDDVTITVRSTRHGPLLSDAADDLRDVADVAEGADPDHEYAVALAWTALEPGTTADAILDLNQAADWDDFRAAAASFDVPAQNLVYADRAGHIGYQAPGRVPVRRPGHDGNLPAAGWQKRNDWTGRHVPFAELPWVLDPEEGFVVTANQAVIGPDYPHHLTDDWDRGYRSQRIRDLLDSSGRISPERMLEVQLDSRNPMAPVLTPYVLDLRVVRGYYRAGQDVLRRWSFDQAADSAGAAFFNVLWSNVLALTFHDELPEELWPDGGERWFAAVTDLLRDPRNAWWDDATTDDVVEDRDVILHRAMIDARDELTRRQALDPQDWAWGGLHRLDLHSPTLGESGIGPVEWLVNRDGRKAGGSTSAVDATAWDAAEGYEVTSAPSMRMVVDLAELDASRWINLTGVSGHPFHEHYDDQTDLWLEGRTLRWPFSREAVEETAEDTLVLEPAPDPVG